MVSTVVTITLDAADPWAQAQFWSGVTGSPAEPDDPDAAAVSIPGGPDLLFIRVPEGKQVKNRVHVDLAPQDRTRDEEVDRLTALGATLLDDRRAEDGTGWVVLADPEGNEFCVERSAQERSAQEDSAQEFSAQELSAQKRGTRSQDGEGHSADDRGPQEGTPG